MITKKIFLLVVLSAFTTLSVSSQLLLGSFFLAKHLHTKTQEDSTLYNENKNLIELQPSELVFSRVGLSYEQMLSPTVSIKIPMGLGVTTNSGDNYGLRNYMKNYVGIQCLYFPTGHKLASYIAGISVKGGFVENYIYVNRVGSNGIYIREHYLESKKFIIPEVLNGFRVNLGQQFSLTSIVGIGMLKKDDPFGVDMKVTAQFGMGIKF